jgi:hypothetical protein
MLSLNQCADLVRKGHDDYASVEKARAKVLAEALPALDSSIQSIAKYGDPDDKHTAIAASIGQFIGYVMEHGVDRVDAEAAANRVVAKLSGKQPKPKSKFPTLSPEEQRTRLNRPNTSAKVPQQQRTKPLKPGEEEDESLSDPYDELTEAAKSLREKNPELTEAQAFEKVYLGNRGLQGRHYQERMAKLGVNLDGRMAENVV